MRFQHAALPLPLLWSSPFVRWQGSLADVPSLDLAAAVTGDALTARQFDRSAIGRIVLGMTIPQAHSFYGAPWLAARLGLADVSGPLVAQACATSVACLVAAAAEVEADADALPLVVTTDRTSNGPCSSIRAAPRWAEARRPSTGCSTASPPIRTPARRWSRPPRTSPATAP
jgi:acetyl-CoA C-acetyltransferase